MEDNLVMQNQKVGVFDIIRKAPRIFSKNFNFIIFISLTSLPLFFFMIYFEIFLQITLVDAFHLSPAIPEKSTKDFLHELVQLGLLYLVPRHLLELCTIIATVDLASEIYIEKRPMALKEMIHRPIFNGSRMRGTLITSYYVLFFSITTASVGLTCLAKSCYFFWANSMFVIFAALNGPLFGALLAKYLEWSAVWNMGIVISVLEGAYGAEALELSAYFSEVSERRGLHLMLLFFVWELATLRMTCLYFGFCEGVWGIAAQVSLFCLGNVMKWAACGVYFYDCKTRTLQKIVDDEEVGRETKAVGK